MLNKFKKSSQSFNDNDDIGDELLSKEHTQFPKNK